MSVNWVRFDTLFLASFEAKFSVSAPAFPPWIPKCNTLPLLLYLIQAKKKKKKKSTREKRGRRAGGIGGEKDREGEVFPVSTALITPLPWGGRARHLDEICHRGSPQSPKCPVLRMSIGCYITHDPHMGKTDIKSSAWRDVTVLRVKIRLQTPDVHGSSLWTKMFLKAVIWATGVL